MADLSLRPEKEGAGECRSLSMMSGGSIEPDLRNSLEGVRGAEDLLLQNLALESRLSETE